MDSIYSNNTQNLSFNMNMQIDQQTGPCMKSDHLTYFYWVLFQLCSDHIYTKKRQMEADCNTHVQLKWALVARDVLPVPNLLKGWLGLPVAFSNWNSLQASFIRFFSCSESTAFTSRSLQLSSNSGHRKNWANLQRLQNDNQAYIKQCI